MKKTFVCDETMIITIPIGCLKDGSQGELMPDKFQCMYRDSYKVFTTKGKPKPVGAAQAVTGVFIFLLGLFFGQLHFGYEILMLILTLPCAVYVLSGLLSFAAGRSPNMHVTKLAFSSNIISTFWSIPAIIFHALQLYGKYYPYFNRQFEFLIGVHSLILTLLVAEMFVAIFSIYWLSKAVCRDHFNTLPIVLLKQGE